MRKVHTAGPAEVIALGRKGVYEISLSLEDHCNSDFGLYRWARNKKFQRF